MKKRGMLLIILSMVAMMTAGCGNVVEDYVKDTLRNTVEGALNEAFDGSFDEGINDALDGVFEEGFGNTVNDALEGVLGDMPDEYEDAVKDIFDGLNFDF